MQAGGGAHAPRVRWPAPSPTTKALWNEAPFGDSLALLCRPARRRSAHARARGLPGTGCAWIDALRQEMFNL